MSTRGRGGRGRGRAPSAQTQLKAFERRVMGFKAPPRSLDPTTIVDRPWNSLVLIVNNTIVVSVPSVTTIGHLQRYVRGLYNIPSTTEVIIKVSSVQVWFSSLTTAGTVSTPTLKFQAYDLGTANIRSQQSDTGALGRPAKAGYVWPISDTKQVFGDSAATDTVVVAATLSAVGVSNTKHVHFMWNIEGA